MIRTGLVAVLVLASSTANAESKSLATFSAGTQGVLRARSGNFAYSPASIAMALSMTREGARGETAVQMDRALGASTPSESKALLALLAKKSDISVANRIFADAQTSFEKPFLDITSVQGPGVSPFFGGDRLPGKIAVLSREFG